MLGMKDLRISYVLAFGLLILQAPWLCWANPLATMAHLQGPRCKEYELNFSSSSQQQAQEGQNLGFTLQLDAPACKNINIRLNHISTGQLGVHYGGLTQPLELQIPRGQSQVSYSYTSLSNTLADGGALNGLYVSGSLNEGIKVRLGNIYTHVQSLLDDDGNLGGGVSEVFSGQGHTCAIKSNQELWCWGDNSSGQVGASGNNFVPRPSLVGHIKYTKLVAGSYNTCGITVQGYLRCWGDNYYQQIVENNTPYIWAPVTVEQESQWVELAMGIGHSCAINDGGWLTAGVLTITDR